MASGSMSFDVDVSVRRGDAQIACRFAAPAGLTVLVGPSGSGKTSVLHAIAGLIRPERGRVAVAGRTLFDGETDLAPEERRAGYVFQETRLFPHLSVRANLAYAKAQAEPPAWLGIDHLLDRRPRTLSGGEARRVAIARALLSDPAFLLLDEPLSSLDPARREEVMTAIEHLRDAAGLPILMVTHDRDEAARLATTTVTIG